MHTSHIRGTQPKKRLATICKALAAASCLVAGGASATDVPMFGYGNASAYTPSAAQSLLAGMTSLNNTSTTDAGGDFIELNAPANLYAWLAVPADESAGGIVMFGDIGFDGWGGAGMAGNNPGEAETGLDKSTIVVMDSTGSAWRLFREDYAGGGGFFTSIVDRNLLSTLTDPADVGFARKLLAERIATTVPEPASVWLLLAGLAGIVTYRRKAAANRIR